MKLIYKVADCDLCPGDLDWTPKPGQPGFPAEYDAPTKGGPWANQCAEHFALNGSPQVGYRLTRDENHPDLRENRSKADQRKDLAAAIQSGDFDAAEDIIGDGDIAEWL
jgi:hypothetical protein